MKVTLLLGEKALEQPIENCQSHVGSSPCLLFPPHEVLSEHAHKQELNRILAQHMLKSKNMKEGKRFVKFQRQRDTVQGLEFAIVQHRHSAIITEIGEI